MLCRAIGYAGWESCIPGVFPRCWPLFILVLSARAASCFLSETLAAALELHIVLSHIVRLLFNPWWVSPKVGSGVDRLQSQAED